MADAESIAMRRRILEELDQLERESPGSTGMWRPTDAEPDYELRVRETEYLIERGLIKGTVGGDHWIHARILADGRDLLETLRSTRMASVVEMTIPAPKSLPPEWKELTRGIAAKHKLNAEPHLTKDGLYVVLTTYADGPQVADSAAAFRAEIMEALAQPSRIGSEAGTGPMFINNGQVGAMGPGAIAAGFTFQQQINAQPLGGDEQRELIEQLDRLMGVLKLEASQPEHFTALAEVSRAQLEAKNGDRNRVTAALKAAGKWVTEIAVEIGAKAVAEMVKDRM